MLPVPSALVLASAKPAAVHAAVIALACCQHLLHVFVAAVRVAQLMLCQMLCMHLLLWVHMHVLLLHADIQLLSLLAAR